MKTEPRPWDMPDPKAPRQSPYWLRRRDPGIEREHVRLMEELRRMHEEANRQ